MSSINGPVKIAILDDYQNVALQMADWSSLDGRAPSQYSAIISPTLAAW